MLRVLCALGVHNWQTRWRIVEFRRGWRPVNSGPPPWRIRVEQHSETGWPFDDAWRVASASVETTCSRCGRHRPR